ncbi:IS5/IS1182 family transposase, partial [Sinorhizobium medicae]
MIRKVRSKHRLRIIEGLLPTERGRKSRPAHDNRQYLNGMLHVLR